MTFASEEKDFFCFFLLHLPLQYVDMKKGRWKILSCKVFMIFFPKFSYISSFSFSLLFLSSSSSSPEFCVKIFYCFNLHERIVQDLNLVNVNDTNSFVNSTITITTTTTITITTNNNNS